MVEPAKTAKEIPKMNGPAIAEKQPEEEKKQPVANQASKSELALGHTHEEIRDEEEQEDHIKQLAKTFQTETPQKHTSSSKKGQIDDDGYRAKLIDSDRNVNTPLKKC